MAWRLKNQCTDWTDPELVRVRNRLMWDASKIKSRAWACPVCESLHLTRRGRVTANRWRSERDKEAAQLRKEERRVRDIERRLGIYPKQKPKPKNREEWLARQKQACKRKQHFDTREAAVFFAKARGLRAYQCPVCNGWHLTSSIPLGFRNFQSASPALR